ncbi:hypothetical protein OQA88_4336 [Cercophora sp. LCS_1]
MAAPNLNLAHYQDVLGQLPRLKTYTHILLGFALSDDQTPNDCISALETSARALVDAFPWLACQVVHEDGGAGDSGRFRLAHCAQFAAPNSIVRVKDCTDVCPTYHEILNARGPVSMLDGRILGPVPAFPQIYADAELHPAPVFTMQVNLVRGGVLVDAAAQHNFIDGGGLLRLLELLAQSMRGGSFSPEALQHGNRDRSRLITLLHGHEPILDHSHLLREPLEAVAAGTRMQPPPSRQQQHPPQGVENWAFVRFPAHQVAALKSRANNDIADTKGGAFVSTNDALSAFIWQRLAAVRLDRRQTPDDFSKFSRALDARRALGIPRDYLGQMGYNATCRLTFGQLREMTLGELALFMRRAVEKVNNEYSARSWATFVAREKDKSRIMFGGSFDPDTDVGLSSLIHASVQGVAFGVLGRPDFVRRPRFAPLRSCVYLWTATAEGDVDALLCLNGVDWDALRDDAEWSGHTEYIG